MYNFYRFYLCIALCVMLSTKAQEALSGSEKPIAKQQPTTWSKVKRWGTYALGAGTVILGSYVIYKRAVGKKTSGVPSTSALSLVVQFHNELDSIKSLKVLDEKVKEFEKKDDKHKQFAESTQGQLIYDQAKRRIEGNIKEAEDLVKGLGLKLPELELDIYDSEPYFNSLLTKVLVDTEHPRPRILYNSVLFRKFTDQHLDVFKKLIELGANPASTASSDVEIMVDAFRKYYIDEGSTYGGATAKPEQLPYDREIIKALVLNGGMASRGGKDASKIAELMQIDPELKKFFKEQGYSADGVKYKSWWK